MKDLRNTALYIVNGIICDYVDYNGKYPTAAEVRENFNFPYYGNISDNDILNIINNVKKYDN